MQHKGLELRNTKQNKKKIKIKCAVGCVGLGWVGVMGDVSGRQFI